MGYINKEDTIKELQKYLDIHLVDKEKDKIINDALELAIGVIKKMQEYEEEKILVRCKDCKYYDTEFTNFAGKHRCNYFSLGINDDNFYCGQGVRE